MLEVTAPDIEEVRLMARLLVTGFPDDALRIADALAIDNREGGDTERAELWVAVAAAIGEMRSESSDET